jgi:DNA replication protein DnaD
MKSVSAKHCYYLKRYNEANNGVNCLNNGVNQPIYKQSKVNSSSCSSNNDTENLKASEGVVTQEVVERADALLASSEQQSAEYREKYGDSIAGFEVIKGAACSAYERERIIGFADKYGSWWVEEALKVAGDNGADNILSYLDKVLQNWQNDGKETWESKSQGSKKAQGSKGVRKQKKNSEYADSNYAGEVDYGKYF